VFTIPLCLLVTLVAAVHKPELAWQMPTHFWYLLPVLLGAALLGVTARYAAQGLCVNPVYHDALRYGVMLTVQFVYDYAAFSTQSGGRIPLGLLGLLFLTIGLSLGSSFLLFRASKGSTK